MSEPDGQGILDTSVVIALTDLQNAAVLPALSFLTTVTLAELSVGPLIAGSDAIRRRRQGNLQIAEGNFEPLSFDVAAARAFGPVSACLRRAGRKRHSRSLDAMIAAIAIANGLPLYTCNPADFEGIDELRVVAVPPP